MSIDTGRLREVDAIVFRARQLAGTNPDVRAVVVVGSYAYGRPTMESDIDIVMAVNNRDAWLLDDSWVGQIIGSPFELVRDRAWGPLRERRYRAASGFEVELGLVSPHWFTTPVDSGTAKVLRDGCRIVTDTGLLARDALLSLALPTTEWTSAGATFRGELPASQS